jgi:hypothetical protein
MDNLRTNFIEYIENDECTTNSDVLSLEHEITDKTNDLYKKQNTFMTKLFNTIVCSKQDMMVFNGNKNISLQIYNKNCHTIKQNVYNIWKNLINCYIKLIFFIQLDDLISLTNFNLEIYFNNFNNWKVVVDILINKYKKHEFVVWIKKLDDDIFFDSFKHINDLNFINYIYDVNLLEEFKQGKSTTEMFNKIINFYNWIRTLKLFLTQTGKYNLCNMSNNDIKMYYISNKPLEDISFLFNSMDKDIFLKYKIWFDNINNFIINKIGYSLFEIDNDDYLYYFKSNATETTVCDIILTKFNYQYDFLNY